MRPISSLFNHSPTVHHSAVVDSAVLPLTVRTSEEAWAYALMFAPADVAIDAVHVVVRVSVTVAAGRIGIGCLDAQHAVFIDEDIAGQQAGGQMIDLLIPGAPKPGALVVRNADSGASQATIHDVSCYAVEPSDDTDRSVALSAPRPMSSWSRYYGTAGDTALEKVRVKRFEALDSPVIVRWADGLSFEIVPGDQLSRALYVSGTYEPNTLAVLQALLKPADVFLDLGANAGIMSVIASRWVGPAGRVYSFEPSEREFARLVDNIERNNAANIVPVQAAVTSRTGHAQLRVATAEYGGLNTLGDQFPYDGVGTARMEQVRTTTLDAFVEGASIERVAVAKLDVEGAEVAALHGASRMLAQHRPALVIEVFSKSLAANHASSGELQHLLHSTAYQMFAIDDAARLRPISTLDGTDEQNVVALPKEAPPQKPR